MLTQGSHIAVKRGVFHYRRRVPGDDSAEVTFSLRTKGLREAEYLAGLLDRAFDGTCERMSDGTGTERLRQALRDELRLTLDADARDRAERPPRSPLYAYWWSPEDRQTLLQAELVAIRDARDSLTRELQQNAPDDLMQDHADILLARYGIPAELRPQLLLGLLENAIRAWNAKEARTLGTEPVVAVDPVPPPPAAQTPPEQPPAAPPKPLASALVESFFRRRAEADRATNQVIGQERGTLRRFIEAAGDKPIDQYGRADITGFLALLRQLPTTYGRSPADKSRTLAELIAMADQRNAPRLTDKTAKRHLSVLSQFFHLAVDAGHLTVAARNELVGDHRFRETSPARDQRDAWTTAELRTLFASPVWTGCHRIQRATPGRDVIRDARFWLPILALFHGARLEELADLYRRDVIADGDIWALNITETEGRRLKTDNSARLLPLHPELIRLGFLDYVARMPRRR